MPRQRGLPIPILAKVPAVIRAVAPETAASAGASCIERSRLVLDLEHANGEPRAVHAAAVGEPERVDMLAAANHRVVAEELRIHQARVEVRTCPLHAAETGLGAKDEDAFPVNPHAGGEGARYRVEPVELLPSFFVGGGVC